MTDKEAIFVQKWNTMLRAAKDMEAEGRIKTDFGFKLVSDNNYTLERQTIANELNRSFLDNKYTLE